VSYPPLCNVPCNVVTLCLCNCSDWILTCYWPADVDSGLCSFSPGSPRCSRPTLKSRAAATTNGNKCPTFICRQLVTWHLFLADVGCHSGQIVSSVAWAAWDFKLFLLIVPQKETFCIFIYNIYFLVLLYNRVRILMRHMQP